MDGRKIGDGYLKFHIGLRNNPGSGAAGRLHGGLCNRQDEMETVRGNDDLFSHRYDDPGTLYFDSGIYRSFTHIALPLARTGLFVTGLMTFVANWNELLLAMVFISDDAKKTLPVSLSKFVGPYNTNYSQMFAAIVIAIIPTIVVYCMFSNQIVDGLTAGAVKG